MTESADQASGRVPLRGAFLDLDELRTQVPTRTVGRCLSDVAPLPSGGCMQTAGIARTRFARNASMVAFVPVS